MTTDTPLYVVYGSFRGRKHYLSYANNRVQVTEDLGHAHRFRCMDAALVASMTISTTHKLVDPGFEMVSVQ
jgi:hypothetical protein